MIAPQELRIGNITDKGIIKNFYESGIHVGLGKCFGFEEISPIELNEDWLLKLGYKSDKNEYFVSDLDRFNVFLTVKNTYMLCDCETAIKYIKYVHELQNLYFALTGEELTLNNK